MTAALSRFVLTLSCPDRPGIVAAISGCLAENGWNITDSAQFGDAETGRFFMRTSFAVPQGLDLAAAKRAFEPIFSRFEMKSSLHDLGQPPKIIIMVSRFG